MLTTQMLQQLLLDSEQAAQYFREAQLGLYFDPQYHDLFYDQTRDLIDSHHSNNPNFPNQPDQQLICRIHGQEPTEYVWPDIDFKQFVSLCLTEYDQLFHEHISTNLEPPELQQQQEQQKDKTLLHEEELER